MRYKYMNQLIIVYTSSIPVPKYSVKLLNQKLFALIKEKYIEVYTIIYTRIENKYKFNNSVAYHQKFLPAHQHTF